MHVNGCDVTTFVQVYVNTFVQVYVNTHAELRHATSASIAEAAQSVTIASPCVDAAVLDI